MRFFVCGLTACVFVGMTAGYAHAKMPDGPIGQGIALLYLLGIALMILGTALGILFGPIVALFVLAFHDFEKKPPHRHKKPTKPENDSDSE